MKAVNLFLQHFKENFRKNNSITYTSQHPSVTYFLTFVHIISILSLAFREIIGDVFLLHTHTLILICYSTGCSLSA